MRDYTTLTYDDIVNLVLQANRAGMRGEYIYDVVIHHPYTATQSPNSAIGMKTAPLSSGSASEPIPNITVI